MFFAINRQREMKLKKAITLIIALLWFIFLAGTFASPQDFGSIEGVMKDSEGSSLPGVKSAVALDVFNILNSAPAIKQDNVISSDDFGKELRVLDPRVVRFGIGFNF